MYAFLSRLQRLTARSWTAVLVGLLAVSVVATGCDSTGSNDDDMQQPSIAERVSERGDLSTLLAALDAAGLTSTFADENGDNGDDQAAYTVFAPNNAAFEPLTVADLTQDRTDLLADILQYHVVEQEVLAGDLEDGDTIQTLAGDQLNVAIENGNVFINGAQVVEADIQASNGVVHVIDNVLLENRTVPERLSVTSATTTLTAAVEAAGLTGTLNGSGPFTVFAPNNPSFEPLTVDDLVNNRTDLLSSVLQYHVVSGEVLAGDLEDGDTIQTLQGDQLEVTIEDGDVFINGAQVVAADQRASNGVVHQVDNVLLENRTVAERISVTSATTTLSAAIDAAGLTDALNGNGPFTVFAPNNPSFEPLTVDDLVNNQTDLLSEVLQYHVVPQEAFAASLSDGDMLETLQGDQLEVTIEDGDVFINGAQVVATDRAASNGVVHQVDAALLENRTAYERISVTSATQELQAAIDRVGLTSTLNDEGATFTVFAPGNDAIPDDLSGLSDQELQDILEYHVISGAAVQSGSISDGQTATTVEGSDVTFSVGNDGSITVNASSDNPGTVTRADLGVNNGIVHQIDGLLMPPSN
jgi:transforming growth factor-beta-induced protein